MYRVVFDTNVFISALISPEGKASRVFRRVIAGEAVLYSSVPILTELANKLTEKFDWDVKETQQTIRFIGSIAKLVRPGVRFQVLADGPDNRILECAVAAEAEMIVTGDRHLLALQRYEEVKIQTLAEFAALLGIN